MAAFYHIVHKIQSSSTSTNSEKIDIISALPLGLSTSIFRRLDHSSMYAAMRVSKTWNRVYRSDRELRRSLKRKVIERREQKALLIHNLSVRPTDSWYRTHMPVSQRLGAPNQPTRKRKRTSTEHRIQSAKLLRM
jgi:hypothetical protein